MWLQFKHQSNISIQTYRLTFGHHVFRVHIWHAQNKTCPSDCLRRSACPRSCENTKTTCETIHHQKQILWELIIWKTYDAHTTHMADQCFPKACLESHWTHSFVVAHLAWTKKSKCSAAQIIQGLVLRKCQGSQHSRGGEDTKDPTKSCGSVEAA